MQVSFVKKALRITTRAESKHSGYPHVEAGIIEFGPPIKADVKWVERAAGSSKERHCPPRGETHIVTVEQGQLEVSWVDHAGETHTRNIGEGSDYQTIIFADWESVTFPERSGHSSVGGPIGARIFHMLTTDSVPFKAE